MQNGQFKECVKDSTAVSRMLKNTVNLIFQAYFNGVLGPLVQKQTHITCMIRNDNIFVIHNIRFHAM
jgi:hypothetical protein